MSKDIAKITNTFVKTHSLTNVTYQKLKAAAVDIGYTLIEFNAIFNDADVEAVIKNLRIDESLLRARGFTYADANYRLIFLNEDLTEKEKLIVLAHEIGHVLCNHTSTHPVIGRDVKEEYEANEFAHYLLNPGIWMKCKRFLKRHTKAVVISLIALVVLVVGTAGGLHMKKEASYHGDYYVTPTGAKYHKRECMYIKDKTSVTRLTEEEYATGKYKACDACLPDE